jgi:Zn-dependent protease
LSSSAFIIAIFEFVLLLFSLSFHECAHAWTASMLGDQTARLQGRITLNPMYHVDPIGTLLFPALIIFGPFIGFNFFSGFIVGWAKPTPVITRNFRKMLVLDSLSGAIALAAPSGLQAIVVLSVLAIEINLSLFYFNLLPIPPLDGSRLLRNALPYNAVQAYDRMGGWVGYLLMIFVGGFILRLLLGPSLALVYGALLHI